MPDPFTADCGIIGGGAAGLAAAVFLSRLSGGRLTAVVLEKGPRVGKKLLATGNGTCNLSNRHATVAHYHGQDPHFAVPALAAFPPAETVAFFTAIGVECVERENGRIYPLCAQAGAVLDCLRLTLAAWLAPTMGLKGVWLAMCIELCFRGVIFLLRLGWVFRKKPSAV